MTSNTMNFGPEWMRRFPAKTSTTSTHSSQHDLLPRAPSPLQDWGQLAGQSAGSAMTPGMISGGGHPNGPAFSYSSVAATNARSLNGPSSATLPAGSHEAPLSEGIASDTLNPFKYSKDLMLSLYKPVGFPIEFERHEYATSEDALLPMSSQPFSDQEIKILSGSVNSEVARRVVQPGEGGQERSQGQRRESLSNNEHSKDRDHTGRHDRSDRSIQSRGHDPKHQGSNVRPRHLNTEDRSQSFKRTEQGSRDQEDGLWNSPVRNALGSFDSNGVFRVVHERDESLEPATDPKRSSLEPEETTQSSSTSLQAPITAEPVSSQSDSSLEPNHSGSRSLLNGSSNNDAYSFTGNPMSGSLDIKPVREEPSFAAFGSSQAPGFNSGPVYESAPAELSKWLYRDPTGSIQGPFASEEMHEWYKGGFFTMELLVKREQDTNFEPLGALIRKIGSDEKPFLLADLQAATPLARPNISLPQNRQGSGLGHFNSSSWGGVSAPSTPGTPSFGVDRMFLQQQQQQYSSGDLFGGGGNPPQHQQQQQPAQDSFSGLDQKWNSGLFGPSQGLDSNLGGAGGWSGDAFSRSSMASLGGPQTPLGGNFMSQQGRLLNQQLERQQYMQLLQRQIQMQLILHQQQFMAAQQQFGNDPHALSSLVAQQQAQQRQLQMRLQQVQHMGFHGVGGVTTPGGSAMPWGGLGQQPSSPWSSSIIQPNSDNYFEYGNSDNNNNNGGHSMMQQQQQQHQQQQRDQPQSFTQQSQQQPQHQHQQEQRDTQEQHAPKPAEVEDSVQEAAQDLEKLELTETHHQHLEEQTHQTPVDSVVEPAQEDAREEPVSIEQYEPAVEDAKDEKIEPVVEEKVNVEEHQAWEEPRQETPEPEIEEQRNEFDQDQDDSKSAITENASEGAASDDWGVAPEQQQQQPRPIKAVPAPWAKPSWTDESSEKKAPTLREIQEMEAKRAEEVRAAERQAQAATAASGLLDFGKGLGGTPWQTASAPKKKTLREIQEEEEAALKRARSVQAAAQPAAAQPAAAAPTSGTGLAGIVAAGTGSVGKRYADTIGPKPVTVSANAGPWGTPSSVIAAKPLSMSRTTSAYASATSLSSSAASSPAVRAVDTNSWIEVDNKRGNKPSIETPAPAPVPVVRAPVSSHNRISDEPRPASEEFLRWCRQALKGLQNVVLEDFIQMLLSFPLNPDPMTVEIIQDSIYANSQSLNGRQFADEFIKRRKADAYPSGMAPVSASAGNNNSNNNLGSTGGHDGSFKVVSKKGKKKN
ncbi:hypothetical protein BGZ95_000360 [Linnemannia exigua]|uniref:GYF domain-containing protein n=1 Tax=Linnemannia exigua TaxID=604196 RepID=A0AAD4D8P5_9FUNG|nr:hypothetical protein BGZ95_000360 [Linnemannia exigua]